MVALAMLGTSGALSPPVSSRIAPPWFSRGEAVLDPISFHVQSHHVVAIFSSMLSERDSDPLSPLASAQFTTTHWTVVLTAGNAASPDAQEALEKLCRTYWYPLYAYLRRRGFGEHDAQDITQGFLAQLLARDSLMSVSQERGKFRSFLLASLNFFVADERDKAGAAKRGGGQTIISLDGLEPEERYRLEPVEEQNAELIFERRWAMTVLEEVMSRLRAEFEHAGKQRLFDQLQPFLLGEKSHATYGEIGAELCLSEGAVKMAVLRLRKRYRELFRHVIAATVADPADVDEELRFLFSVISR